MMNPLTLSPDAKILVVKLADLGDVLTTTPALHALRMRYPAAKIDVLVTHHTASVFKYSSDVDVVIPSNNFRFFSAKAAIQPAVWKEFWQVLRRLRQTNYDAVLVLHHLTTAAGALKYAAFARAARAKIVVGLHPPRRRGAFLSHFVPDMGFGARHEIEYWLDVAALLGAVQNKRDMALPISSAEQQWIAQVLQKEDIHEPLVIIHPGSGGFSTARRWSAENFAAVADALIADGATVALVGKPGDGTDAVQSAMRENAVNFTGKTSLHQLAALLARAQLFIGGDSGVTHIAAASGVPMVSIFGPTNASAWGAHGAQKVVLNATLPCAPCAYVGHVVGLRFGCEALTCLKYISPDSVLAMARRLLNGETIKPQAASFQKENKRMRARILGVELDVVTRDSTLKKVDDFIAEGTPHQICTVNPEFVVAAQSDAVFRRIINRAALSFADGNGLLKASRWLKTAVLPERVTGVDLVDALAKRSAEKGYRLFFLGAQPGVAEKAAEILAQRYPGMVCAGTFAGSPRAEDENAIVARLRAANPDVVFVAYGAPKQDKWIARNMHRLPAKVLVGVGGAFDFISGTAQRAPDWVQQLGLEWMHRLVMQPWRWRRIWNAVPRFLWLVLKERIGWGVIYED